VIWCCMVDKTTNFCSSRQKGLYVEIGRVQLRVAVLCCVEVLITTTPVETTTADETTTLTTQQETTTQGLTALKSIVKLYYTIIDHECT